MRGKKEGRNVSVIMDADGKKLVIINDVRFKGKRNIDWEEVKKYIKGYVGEFYEMSETAEKNVFTGKLLVNHAENGKKYLYDILAIKKETRNPQQ